MNDLMIPKDGIRAVLTGLASHDSDSKSFAMGRMDLETLIADMGLPVDGTLDVLQWIRAVDPTSRTSGEFIVDVDSIQQMLDGLSDIPRREEHEMGQEFVSRLARQRNEAWTLQQRGAISEDIELDFIPLDALAMAKGPAVTQDVINLGRGAQVASSDSFQVELDPIFRQLTKSEMLLDTLVWHFAVLREARQPFAPLNGGISESSWAILQQVLQTLAASFNCCFSENGVVQFSRAPMANREESTIPDSFYRDEDNVYLTASVLVHRYGIPNSRLKQWRETGCPDLDRERLAAKQVPGTGWVYCRHHVNQIANRRADRERVQGKIDVEARIQAASSIKQDD